MNLFLVGTVCNEIVMAALTAEEENAKYDKMAAQTNQFINHTVINKKEDMGSFSFSAIPRGNIFPLHLSMWITVTLIVSF